MATKSWYFQGVCKWAKLVDPDKEYQKYSLDLYMDAANMAKFAESGAQLKLRGTEAEPYITFSRPVAGIGKNGELREYGPPTILDAENNPMDKGILVGNGSKVTVKVDIYDTRKGKGTRLEAVRVDDLVEYIKKEIDLDIDTPF